MKKKHLEFKSFSSNILVPFLTIIFYSAYYALISSRFLFKGVTYFFAANLWKILLLLLVCIYIISLIYKKKKWSKKYLIEKLVASDLILIFLPLAPIVRYIIANQDSLSLNDSLFVLFFFIIFICILVFFIPLSQRNIASTKNTMIFSLAFVFTIFCMPILSRDFLWYEKGNLIIQLIFFFSTLLIMLVLYNLNKNILYILSIVLFFTLNITQKTTYKNPNKLISSRSENNLLLLTEQRKPKYTPNIYLLIYDAYVPNETMLSYGIDNSYQEEFLKEQGFILYPKTYSIGSHTTSSMSTVFNVANDYYGNIRRGASGDGIVQTILTNIGYETYGVFTSDYLFLGIDSSYSYSVPDKGSGGIGLASEILIGELGNVFMTNRLPHDQFVNFKRNVFNDVSKGQNFIYTHSDLPGHSQDSGKCRPDETNLFKDRLSKANLEMREDIQSVSENDPESVIIVAGDHGPYLTKNCTKTSKDYDISEISRTDIQDRYGTFLAIKWPTENYVKYDDIVVLQDLFPSIFSYIYKDETILESRIDPIILPASKAISGASVNNGIIEGGMNDGEKLYILGN